jgi:hypothetical protein
MVNSGATRNKMSAKIAISAISPPVGGLLASIASRRGPTALYGRAILGHVSITLPHLTGARASSLHNDLRDSKDATTARSAAVHAILAAMLVSI